MKRIILAALFTAIATTASAQDLSPLSIAKSVALSPTTYAPAIIYRAALRRDWATSQPLFALGFVEQNRGFARDMRGTPIGYADGNAKINRLALRLAVDSAVHNTASHVFERMLLKEHPQHKTLIKVLGVVERTAVASALTYSNSAKHFRQATINQKMLEATR